MTKNAKSDKNDKKLTKKFKSTNNNNLSTSKTAEQHARIIDFFSLQKLQSNGQ